MKCTIRKSDKGIVATDINISVKEEHYFYDPNTDWVMLYEKGDPYLTEFELILASTFGVGMELVFKPNCPDEWVNFDTEYPYTIQYNKLIITL